MVDFEYYEKITAYCPKNQFRVELIFKSIQEAKLHNPHLEDFRSVEIIKVKKSYY